jgi:IS1 family transposase
VECDELWAYVGKKQRRVTKDELVSHSEFGDAYTFVGLDPATKLVVSYLVGKRDLVHTENFIKDLSQRIEGTVQISTDGFRPYITAIQRHFGYRATHGELVKVYASVNPGPGRYAPPKVAGITKTDRWGTPNRSKICTSYVERNNLTIRCQIRRFTRLTNAFSKKLKNLKASVSLWFAYYNFCRVHGSLRVTPAMEAGITNTVWELSDLIA